MLMEHIQQDWSELNKFGKIIIYPFWFIRSIFIWILCPFYIPEYLFKQSVVYKSFNSFLEADEISFNQQKIINKINTNSYLNNKSGVGRFKFASKIKKK